jgi:hypothetical protein
LETVIGFRADEIRYVPHGNTSTSPRRSAVIAALIAFVSSCVPFPVAPKVFTLRVAACEATALTRIETTNPNSGTLEIARS